MKYPNLKTFLAIFIFAATVLLPARLCAQSMELITFIPVKIAGDGGFSSTTNRSYQFISVKSLAHFAQASGGVTIEGALVANSALLDLRAASLSFLPGSDFLVHNSVFTRPGVSLFIKNLQLGGFFYKYPDPDPNTDNTVNLVLTDSALSGRRIDMNGRPLNLRRDSSTFSVGQIIYVDGIPLSPPPAACNTVAWETISADYDCGAAGDNCQTDTFNVLRCSSP